MDEFAAEVAAASSAAKPPKLVVSEAFDRLLARPREPHFLSKLVLACARSQLWVVFSEVLRLCDKEKVPLDYLCEGVEEKPWEVAVAPKLQSQLHAQALNQACKFGKWEQVSILLQHELAKTTLNKLPLRRSYYALHHVAYAGEQRGLQLMIEAAERWNVELDFTCKVVGGDDSGLLPFEVAHKMKRPLEFVAALREGADRQTAAAAAKDASAPRAPAVVSKKRPLEQQSGLAMDIGAAAAAPPSAKKAKSAASKAKAHTFKTCEACKCASRQLFYFQPHPSAEEDGKGVRNVLKKKDHANLYSNLLPARRKLYDNDGWRFVTFGIAEREADMSQQGLRSAYLKRFKQEFPASKMGYKVDSSKAVLLTHESECVYSYERSLKTLLIRSKRYFNQHAVPNNQLPVVELERAGVIYMQHGTTAEGLKTETVFVSPSMWKMLKTVTSFNHTCMEALKKADMTGKNKKSVTVKNLRRAIKSIFAEPEAA
jgi:ankyrin repeat protein